MRFENNIENEHLFINLHSMHLVGSSVSMNLIENGYLTWDYQKTHKAKCFIDEYYNQHKDLVYYALHKFGNSRKNYVKIKSDCEIEKNFTLETILSRMVSEGLVKKYDEHAYKCI